MTARGLVVNGFFTALLFALAIGEAMFAVAIVDEGSTASAGRYHEQAPWYYVTGWLETEVWVHVPLLYASGATFLLAAVSGVLVALDRKHEVTGERPTAWRRHLGAAATALALSVATGGTAFAIAEERPSFRGSVVETHNLRDGRLRVAFRVLNEGDGAGIPRCHLRVYAPDGDIVAEWFITLDDAIPGGGARMLDEATPLMVDSSLQTKVSC